MQNELVSVIIPVYNAEKYLEQCILSVLKQSYQNIEIVLVNDGSTDGSAEICKRFANTDGRIKLLNEENCGLAKARKNGMALVTGKYVGFVDADDYLDPDLYQKYMECERESDLMIAQWYREEEKKTVLSGDGIACGFYSSEEDMNFIYRHLVSVFASGGTVCLKPGFAPFVWNKLYQSDIARTVFEEICEDISLVEDCDFTYRYFLKCSSVAVTDICGYHYRIRKNSESHAVDTKCSLLRNTCRLYNALLPVFSSHAKANILVPQLQAKIAGLIRRSPKRMGFPIEAQNQFFIFPFIGKLAEKQIALYGANFLGKMYWRQIQQWKICDIAIWIDNDYDEYKREGLPVFSPEDMENQEFDFIVIASFNHEEAERIRSMLIDRGYRDEQILWEKPLDP